MGYLVIRDMARHRGSGTTDGRKSQRDGNHRGTGITQGLGHPQYLLSRACKPAASGSVSTRACDSGTAASAALNSWILRPTASTLGAASKTSAADAGTWRVAGAARFAADVPSSTGSAPLRRDAHRVAEPETMCC